MTERDALAGIPELPQMRELTLGDREVVEAALARERPGTSELTFTNLFIWRHAYGLRLAQVEGALCVFSWRADPAESFLLPPLLLAADMAPTESDDSAGKMSFRGSATTEESPTKVGTGVGDAFVRRSGTSSPANADSSLALGMTGSRGAGVVEKGLAHLRDQGHDAKLARVSTTQLQRLGITDDHFTIKSDRDNWDYVYPVRDLIELAGERYHGKRNHVAQFRAEHKFEYRRLTPDLIPGCVEVQDLWCDERHCDLVATLRAESRAVKEALGELERLSAIGGCILIEGKVQAFTLGEPLNDDTVTIHIEKANPAFHGLYQLINQQFLEHEWQSYAYVNRQQDLGIEGLRRAKESYHPHHMVEKHIVRVRG